MIKKIIFTSLVLISILVSIFLSKYHLVAMFLMIIGFMGLFYPHLMLKIKLRAEKRSIKDAIDSIIDGAEPEVLVRAGSIDILKEIKMDIYELSRVLSDDIDFLRHDVLNNIDIPIYVESGDRVFQNKAMKKLCMDMMIEPVKLNDDVNNNGVLYKKVKVRDGVFYFLLATKVHGA
ncbi:MAG: hypothetical protein WCQ53_00255 [bacterium]